MSHSTDIATVVDDLVTTDISGRNTIGPISASNRQQYGDQVTMRAAEELLETVDPGDNVLVLTGFLIPPTMVQETDGPLGAVSIARAIDIGLDANPIIACEPKARDICATTATAGELSVLDREIADGNKRTVAVQEFPADRQQAEVYVEELLNEVDPAAVVAVEKVAVNSKGVYHNMAGYNISEYTSKVDVLYDELDDDVLTIGIGDAGNEIGMGNVANTVREETEYGAMCQCSCEEGIASEIETDILVPATVSNWGAHAVATCLSSLVNRSILHEAEIERRMLLEASAAGSIDGITRGKSGWCDGMPPSAHESIVELLHEVLSSSVHERGEDG